MKILLSSIGSRGDVQPILALAIELQTLGQQARLCVAPNFKAWVESYGVECIPIGPDLRRMSGESLREKPIFPASEEQRQQLAVQTVRTQFQVLAEAVYGCNLAIGAGALQIALRSVAEANKIPYIFAAYCPAVLPSIKYPPPRTPKTGTDYSISEAEGINQQLWDKNDQEFNERFGAALNEQRANIGLSAIASVRSYIFTDRPWLASDATLAPAFPLMGMTVVQTGAWMLSDQTSLPANLDTFLENGDPPIYLGFGSMQAYEQTGRLLIQAARDLGYRALLSQGWANLEPADFGSDCLVIGDVNHQKLLPRCAAIVHHGGAGTTTAAALAGDAQVIIPHNYDQFYWAHRVHQLGVGISGPTRDELTVDNLVEALDACLHPGISENAQKLAGRIERHGARIAAERLMREYG